MPDSQDPHPDQKLLRVEEAGRLLGIGRTKTWELVTSGALASVCIGKSRRVPRRALDEFVTSLDAPAE